MFQKILECGNPKVCLSKPDKLQKAAADEQMTMHQLLPEMSNFCVGHDRLDMFVPFCSKLQGIVLTRPCPAFPTASTPQNTKTNNMSTDHRHVSTWTFFSSKPDLSVVWVGGTELRVSPYLLFFHGPTGLGRFCPPALKSAEVRFLRAAPRDVLRPPGAAEEPRSDCPAGGGSYRHRLRHWDSTFVVKCRK